MADLCEQRRMAEAAIEQVRWVKAQTYLTIIEILALGGTLFFALWAIRDNRIANRPFIAIAVNGVPDLGRDGAQPADVVVTNQGRSAAKIIGSWAIMGINDWPESKATLRHLVVPQRITLQPDKQYMIAAGRNINLQAGERLALMAGTQKRLYLWGRVTYEDVYRNEYFTAFRLMYGGPTTTTVGQWEACEDGNDTT